MDKKKNITELLKQAENSLQSIDKAYSDYAKSCGLSYTGLCILEVIFDSPDGITQKELCEVTFYNKQTVNMVITSLFKQGYIRFEELANDRRHKYVKLTESGKDFAEITVGGIRKIIESVFDELTEKEAAVFTKTLSHYGKKFTNGVTEHIKTEGTGNEN